MNLRVGLLAAVGLIILGVGAGSAGAAAAAPTVTGVSPAMGRTTGGNQVTVAGTNLGDVTKVLFGSAISTKITHVSSTLIRVIAPVHTATRLDVRVSSSAGASRTTSSDFYYYVSYAPHFSWSKPATVHGTGPGNRRLAGVSCAAVNHCVTVSNDGHAYTWNGHVMSARTFDPDATHNYGFTSCPTTTFCVVGGTSLNTSGGESEPDRSRIVVLHGTTWSKPALFGTRGTTITSLSCVSSTFCMLTASGNAYVYRGSGWTATKGFSPYVATCVTSTFCLGLDLSSTGTVESTFNGSTWSAPRAPYDASGLDSEENLMVVECTMPTFCVSSGYGTPYFRRGNTWGKGESALKSASRQVRSISCPTTSTCVESTTNGTTAFAGAAAKGTGNPFKDSELSCPTDQLCMSVHDTQISIGKRVA